MMVKGVAIMQARVKIAQPTISPTQEPQKGMISGATSSGLPTIWRPISMQRKPTSRNTHAIICA